MDNITKYIEAMNKLQDTIYPPAISVIQEQYNAIENVARQTMIQYAGVYETLSKPSLPLNQYNMNLDAIHSAISSMTSFTNTFYNQEQIISKNHV